MQTTSYLACIINVRSSPRWSRAGYTHPVTEIPSRCLPSDCACLSLAHSLCEQDEPHGMVIFIVNLTGNTSGYVSEGVSRKVKLRVCTLNVVAPSHLLGSWTE